MIMDLTRFTARIPVAVIAVVFAVESKGEVRVICAGSPAMVIRPDILTEALDFVCQHKDVAIDQTRALASLVIGNGGGFDESENHDCETCKVRDICPDSTVLKSKDEAGK
jgi:hypothetical protein